MACLVLVENEVTYEGKYDHWLDSTGESYQFPNQYRKKIQRGTRFVYYRGVRRASGPRAAAEYFGVGRIGTVWRDPSIPVDAPKSQWRWFCSIDDFEPFPRAVPSRLDGAYLESISNTLGWRTGVRGITDETYDRILQLAGLPALSVRTALVEVLPPISDVHVIEQQDPWSTLVAPTLRENSHAGSSGSMRRSPQAKRLGDRAEEIVVNWLRATLAPSAAHTVAWIAKQGRTPGWDIEFIDEAGSSISVEVKGSSTDVFRAFEVTAQEWAAARERRLHYWLVLVTNCIGISPRVTVIRDPHSLMERGELQLEPSVWRVRRPPASS